MMLEQAGEVTLRLEERLIKSRADIEATDLPVAELEVMLPHLDGTPLEQEDCVIALRRLLDQLEALATDSAASIAAARAMLQQTENDPAVGEELLNRAEGVTVEAALQAKMAPFEGVRSGLAEQQGRRRQLLAEVRRLK